jgi:hypothetical protein
MLCEVEARNVMLGHVKACWAWLCQVRLGYVTLLQDWICYVRLRNVMPG